jgi:hypothetical protein
MIYHPRDMARSAMCHWHSWPWRPVCKQYHHLPNPTISLEEGRLVAQRRARTVASIVQLQGLKLAIKDQRFLTIQKKGRIIDGNRRGRSQRGSENSKESKGKECHERNRGVEILSTTRPFEELQAQRIVKRGKSGAGERRHVSDFIAAEYNNKTMRLAAGVKRTKEERSTVLILPQRPVVGN